MTKIAVHIFCNECSQVHPMQITLPLDDGPAERASIGDTYAGRELPSEILAVMNTRVTCPETGHLTSQKDNKLVFLVPA